MKRIPMATSKLQTDDDFAEVFAFLVARGWAIQSDMSVLRLQELLVID
jgi:hypothetical protein